jgi:hypothetical protein
MRGSWKDYVDIHVLVSHGIDLPTGLAAAKGIDRSFDPSVSMRTLQFYGDGTLDRVPAAMQRDPTRWARDVDVTRLPILQPRRGLSPEGLERLFASAYLKTTCRSEGLFLSFDFILEPPSGLEPETC